MRADRLSTPVTVVTALAGFGKTTRLSPLRARPGCCWIEVTPAVEASGAISAALDDPDWRVLVVDDAHRLTPGGQEAAALAAAVERPPPGRRLVVSGRPPLPFGLAGARARGHVTALDEDAVAMTPAEIAGLLDSPDAAALAERMHGLTGGWAAILRLAVDELADQGGVEALRFIDESCAPGDLCQDFIADQVLGGLSGDEAQLLQLLAHVGEIDDAVVDAPGVDPGRAALVGLLRRHVVRRQVGAGSRRLGILPVLAATVRARAPLPPRHVATVVASAGGALIERGQLDEGLALVARSQDPHAIVSVLSTHGSRLLREGCASALVEAVRLVPPDDRPGDIVLLLGEALQLRGDHEAALRCYESLRPAGPLPPGLAWRIGLIHYLNGEPERATACYAEAALSGADTPDEAKLLGWMASAAWMAGDEGRCADLARRALAAAQACADPAALAGAHVAMGLHAGLAGNRQELAQHFERAIACADQAPDLLQGVRARTNLAAHKVIEGELSSALDETETAGRLAREAHLPAFEALCRVNSGGALVQLARLDEAMAAFEDAKGIYQRLGSRKVAYALNGIGDVHALRGSLALAQACYTEALESVRRGDDLQADTPALCGLARVLHQREPDQARDLAREAASAAGSFRGQGALALGWILLAEGRTADAQALAAEAGQVAARHRDWGTLAESHELAALAGPPEDAAALLHEAENSWTQAGSRLGVLRLRYARSLLARPDCPGHDAEAIEAGALLAGAGLALEPPLERGLLAAVPPPAPRPVQVTSLGGFAVSVAGEAVSTARWGSRKARTLLKLLVAHGGGPVHRETVIEALWPGARGDLGNRLAVAITALRRALDPTRQHPSDWVVVSRHGLLSLDLQQVSIDVLELAAHAQCGLRLASSGSPDAARTVLEGVVRRHGGTFLPEDHFEDWSTSTREQADELLTRCLCTLAELALEEQASEVAYDLAQRALAQTPSHPRALELLDRIG